MEYEPESCMTLETLKEAMDTQRHAIQLMRTQLREQERFLISRVLGVPHTFDLWSADTLMDIYDYIGSLQRHKRFIPFLNDFGYIRRGRRMVYAGDDALDDIVLANEMTASDFPAEVINSIWLAVVTKKRAAVAKGKFTREMKKRAREEAQRDDAEGAAPKRPAHVVDEDEDEYAASGF